MNCNKCGAPLHDGAQFCTNCGNIMLSDDDTKTVTIDVPESTFEHFDSGTNTMRITPGNYQLLYGTSSSNADLQTLSVKRK